MANYVLYTDANCDMPPEMVEELDIKIQPMRFTLNDKEYYNWPDAREMSVADFYKSLRAGGMTATTQTNTIEFIERFSPDMAEGKDVLYLGFTSGLSGTLHAAKMAEEPLMEEFPGRKVMVVDTLCGSLGQAMLVREAALLRQAGKSMEEVAQWVEENRLRLAHWVTVDDLHFLKRGGRLSGTAALMGTMLSIKPIIAIDDSGRLNVVDKVRGRKNSMMRLLQEMENKGENLQEQTIFVAHADCPEDAQFVAGEIEERFHPKQVVVHYVGPVIGGHTGPNTLAVFFFGKGRA